MSSTTVADAVGTGLARLGVGHAFGVVGSGNFAVTNALRAAGVPFTAARHESAAATMADAFAQVSGQLSVVTLHQGCGLTNATTGIGEAAKSRTPMIVIAAETRVPTSNFAMDQAGLAASVGAAAVRVDSAQSAMADVIRAYRLARDERRCVLLNLPLDVQREQIDGTELGTIAVTAAAAVVPAEDDVATVAQMLADAARPVIIAGRGGRGAGTALRELAAASGALLATSAVANGLFASDPFSLGISGGFASPLAAELIADADLIVAFGCALNNWTTRGGTLIGEQTAVVQVDADAQALGRLRPITHGIVGEAAATAQALIRAVGRAVGRSGAAAGYRSPELAQRIEASIRWRDTPTADASTPERIDPRVFSAALDDLLPTERVVAIDSGNFMGYPTQYLRVPDESGFCFTQSFQAIGLGLASAIGAALAQPDRIPVLGTGDGGLLMAMSELETAVRLGLPLVVAIYNDAAYSAEVHHFGETDPTADLTTVTFPDTDFAAIARGYGATGITVRTVADLAAVTSWWESAPTVPLILDAKIASDDGSWWLHGAFRGH
ncbi:MAG: thiamine pyrophosphate-binding protein [Beutenbergiaceae bacterium]